MDLKDIDVGKVLSQWTAEYIKHADFATLRNACIEFKPIEPVILEVQSYLDNEFESAFETKKTQLTQDSFKSQIREDARESSQDEEENEKDQNLKITLSARLLELKSEIINLKHIDEKISREKDECCIKQSAQEKKLSYYQKELKNLEEASKLKVDVFPSSYQHANPSDIQVQVYPSGITAPAQEQFNPVTPPPFVTKVYKQLPQVPMPIPVDPANEAKQKKYRLKIDQLKEEISALKCKIRTFNIEILGNALSINRLEEDIKKINAQINEDIPNRKRRRSDRAISRKEREAARNSSSESLEQLSNSNRRRLDSSIADVKQTLQSQVRSMIAKAKNESYFLFLELLPANINSQLSNSNLLISLSESMKQYQALQEHIQRLIDSLHCKEQEYRTNKETLESLLKKNNQFKASNSKLEDSIEKLKNQNVTLRKDINTLNKEIKHNTKVCYALLLLSTLIILSYAILLYLDIIPSALMYSGMGLCAATVAGLGYFSCHFFNNSHKKTVAEDQILENTHKISANKKEMHNNEQEVLHIENKSIPQIKLDLYVLPPVIQEIKQEITQTEQTAAELLKRAVANSEPCASQTSININLPSSFFKSGNDSPGYPSPHTRDYYAPSNGGGV